MKPRHKGNQTDAFADTNEWRFLGHAYDLDVYLALTYNAKVAGIREVAVLGAVLNAQTEGKRFNWTLFGMDSDGNINMRDEDILVSLPHLVEIYRLMKENPHETPTDI